ncbi:putative glycosyl hydrolase [Micromonospora sp. Llam0]|uniref:glycoside hydrolase family protein n=1 Tax=Micromonospora sp. Llam0 TaxID=2485143 RepID=UPI000F47BB8F|nr:glycoside hydrolase family protein [Micromonospora sp. Llam0]ROO58722.1 putative glycosyl hydrolase [Micromonospora sp. Llam0]
MTEPAGRASSRSLTALVLAGALLLAGCAGRPAARPDQASATAEPAQSTPPTTAASTPGAAPTAASTAEASTTEATTAADPVRTVPGTAGRASTAPPQPAPVSSARKGVGVWDFPGVSEALTNSKAGWYYTWSTQHPGIRTPAGATFVPMIWGPGSVNPTELARAKQAGPYLLGFNEPDLAEQSNMTVEQALELWPQLEATGNVLGSPAVAWGGADAGGWLDRFMSGAKRRGHRVDFIALHWYGGDFATGNAVNQLKQYLEAVHQRYGKPIWLTEFALIRFGDGGPQFPSEQQQAAFLTAAAEMLAGLPYLQRYAWFGLPATDRDRTGLFTSGNQPTVIGRAFQSAR